MLVLVLAGCQAEMPAEQVQKETPVVPQEQTPVAPQQSDNAKVEYAAPNLSSVTEADRAAYQAAFSLTDSTYCDQIKDEKFKATCLIELSDNKNLNAALDAKDAAFCEKLSNSDKQDACRINVDALLKGDEITRKSDQEIAAREELSDKFIKGGDYKLCAELINQTAINDCEYNILVNEAARQKDPAVCDKAGQDAVRQTCREDAARLIQ